MPARFHAVLNKDERAKAAGARLYPPNTLPISPIFRWILPPRDSASPRSRNRRLPVALPAFDFTVPLTSRARPFALFFVLAFTNRVRTSAYGRACLVPLISAKVQQAGREQLVPPISPQHICFELRYSARRQPRVRLCPCRSQCGCRS